MFLTWWKVPNRLNSWNSFPSSWRHIFSDKNYKTCSSIHPPSHLCHQFCLPHPLPTPPPQSIFISVLKLFVFVCKVFASCQEFSLKISPPSPSLNPETSEKFDDDVVPEIFYPTFGCYWLNFGCSCRLEVEAVLCLVKMFGDNIWLAEKIIDCKKCKSRKKNEFNIPCTYVIIIIYNLC